MFRAIVRFNPYHPKEMPSLPGSTQVIPPEILRGKASTKIKSASQAEIKTAPKHRRKPRILCFNWTPVNSAAVAASEDLFSPRSPSNQP